MLGADPVTEESSQESTSGPCSDQIIAAVISDFVSSEIEVIDRQHLDSILGEHDFALSGYVDPQSAAKIGEILGPSALVFIKVQRCTAESDRLYKKEARYSEERGKYTVTKYISRTRAFLRASMQTVDLATGRIFAAKALEASPVRQNESYEGYPEAPSKYDLTDLAIQSAVFDIHRMFLPWSERRQLYYFNNKKCGLINAFRQLESGELDGALRTSLANLETCKDEPKVKAKVLAHAYYNVGMGYMIAGDHDEAIAYFGEARKTKSSDIIQTAINDCRRAKELKLAMVEIVESAQVAAEEAAAAMEKDADAERTSTLTNADIVKMTGKLPDVVIIAKMKTSKVNFDTSTEALVELAEGGVSEEIITKMLSTGSQ